MLLKEPDQTYNVAKDLGFIQIIILFSGVSLSSIFLGYFGLLVWAQYTFLGFILYYILVCYVLLQLLHIGTRKRL
jgi:hypothetical protein